METISEAVHTTTNENSGSNLASFSLPAASQASKKIPLDSASRCAHCRQDFSLRTSRSNCSCCGYVFCTRSSCFDPTVQVCAFCDTRRHRSLATSSLAQSVAASRTGPRSASTSISSSDDPSHALLSSFGGAIRGDVTGLPDTYGPSGLAESALAHLSVRVVGAKNLIPSDRHGQADSYCVVSLGTKQARTRTFQKSLNPHWDEEFLIPIDDVDTMEALAERAIRKRAEESAQFSDSDSDSDRASEEYSGNSFTSGLSDGSDDSYVDSSSDSDSDSDAAGQSSGDSDSTPRDKAALTSRSKKLRDLSASNGASKGVRRHDSFSEHSEGQTSGGNLDSSSKSKWWQWKGKKNDPQSGQQNGQQNGQQASGSKSERGDNPTARSGRSDSTAQHPSNDFSSHRVSTTIARRSAQLDSFSPDDIAQMPPVGALALQLAVYDEGRDVTDSFMGMVHLPLVHLKPDVFYDHWFPILPRPTEDAEKEREKDEAQPSMSTSSQLRDYDLGAIRLQLVYTVSPFAVADYYNTEDVPPALSLAAISINASRAQRLVQWLQTDEWISSYRALMSWKNPFLTVLTWFVFSLFVIFIPSWLAPALLPLALVIILIATYVDQRYNRFHFPLLPVETSIRIPPKTTLFSEAVATGRAAIENAILELELQQDNCRRATEKGKSQSIGNAGDAMSSQTLPIVTGYAQNRCEKCMFTVPLPGQFPPAQGYCLCGDIITSRSRKQSLRRALKRKKNETRKERKETTSSQKVEKQEKQEKQEKHLHKKLQLAVASDVNINLHRVSSGSQDVDGTLAQDIQLGTILSEYFEQDNHSITNSLLSKGKTTILVDSSGFPVINCDTFDTFDMDAGLLSADSETSSLFLSPQPSQRAENTSQTLPSHSHSSLTTGLHTSGTDNSTDDSSYSSPSSVDSSSEDDGVDNDGSLESDMHSDNGEAEKDGDGKLSSDWISLSDINPNGLPNKNSEPNLQVRKLSKSHSEQNPGRSTTNNSPSLVSSSSSLSSSVPGPLPKHFILNTNPTDSKALGAQYAKNQEIQKISNRAEDDVNISLLPVPQMVNSGQYMYDESKGLPRGTRLDALGFSAKNKTKPGADTSRGGSSTEATTTGLDVEKRLNVLLQARKMQKSLGKIQNIVGEICTIVEQFQALIWWEDPRRSIFLLVLLTLVSIALMIIPFRWLLLVLGIEQYTAFFRRPHGTKRMYVGTAEQFLFSTPTGRQIGLSHETISPILPK